MVGSIEFLPRVTRATIREIGGIWDFDQDDFLNLCGEGKDAWLFWGFCALENHHPYIAQGAKRTFFILEREARKQGKQLPELLLGDFDRYFRNHPMAYMREEQAGLDLVLFGARLQEIEMVGEYTRLTYQKYIDENPVLMEDIESRYGRGVEKARSKEDEDQWQDWEGGCLVAYELLHYKAVSQFLKKVYGSQTPMVRGSDMSD